MKPQKIVFYSLWILIPFLAGYIVARHPLFLGLNSNLSVLNFLLRVTALTALPLLGWQIFLGSFMDKVTSKFGGWVANYHFNQGILIGVLILMHPLMLLTERYLSIAKLDPFYVFTDVCLLCQGRELYLTLGRFGFWLIVVGIVAAKIRHWDWWKANWRFFHWANYVGFLAVLLHGLKVGSDFHSVIYLPLIYLSVGLVVASIVKRIVGLKDFL